MEGVLIAFIAIIPSLLTIIVTCFKDKKKTSLDSVRNVLSAAIKDLKDTMETNDKEIKNIIVSNDKESLKRYLVFMLSRAKGSDDFNFNEFEKSIIKESYTIYRNEHGNSYVQDLYNWCKDHDKL